MDAAVAVLHHSAAIAYPGDALQQRHDVRVPLHLAINTLAPSHSQLPSMEEGEGYVAFKGRQAKGVLYRLNTMPSRLMERTEKYVHGGIMAKDMRYARAVMTPRGDC